MGQFLSNCCFPVKGSETDKHEDAKGEAVEKPQHEEKADNLQSEDSYYLITPCEGIFKIIEK